MDWFTQRFELSPGGSAHNVRPMEGLRGFAVFLVFLVHYVTLINPWISEQPLVLEIASALHSIGNTGVDLFFVLSGYLIYGSLIARPQRFGRFMARRIQRIYPAFLAVFVIYIGVSLAFPAESKIPSTPFSATIYLAENLLLLPGIFPIEPMITVAWSLSYEMFFYLLIPLVISALRLRDRSSESRVTLVAVCAVLGVFYCSAYGGHIRLIMFLSGILLYEAMSQDRIRTPNSTAGLLSLTFALLVTLVPTDSSFGYSMKVSVLFACFFVLCLTCFREPSVWLARAFSWAPMRWLGNMSYSYYLLHGLSLKAAFLALSIVLPTAGHGAWLFWVLLPFMFALSLIPTTALFLTVERTFSLSSGGKQTKGEIKARAESTVVE